MKSRFLLFSALALCSATVAAGNYPTSLYVIGDATPAQWDSNNVIRMVTVEDGVYEYTGDLTEGRMRFVTTYDFAPGYGPAMASTVVGDNDNETYLDLTTGSHELEYRSDYTAPDKSFKVSAAGRYKFRVDLTGEKPLVEARDLFRFGHLQRHVATEQVRGFRRLEVYDDPEVERPHVCVGPA